jgi:signal transduction histidine kinase
LLLRIVMRTGQAGHLPEETVVREYEIDDFREKTELTVHKLRTLVLSKLRAYDDLRRLQAQSHTFELAVQERTQALASAQEHLVQSEKLASIGQLAAGVAHEINNPIGYIFSNFGTLEKYLTDLFGMLALYQQAEPALGDAQLRQQVQQHKAEVDLEFLLEDIPVLMRESREGIVRVRKIVQDLKDFSHVDATQEWQFADLNQGIESTLNIVNNEVKYKADVVRELAPLPEVQCMASQINQVVMNLVVNAAHAIGAQRGTIVVRTAQRGQDVVLEVQDNGSGIPKDVLPRIFDPFFTTKPVGKGTGLGLSLSYGIVQKHHGRIEVDSELGRGTTFRIFLPLKQPVGTPQAEMRA